MQIFGMDITSEHTRMIGPVVGGLLTAGGFVAGRLSHLLLARRLAHEDLVASTMVVEIYGHDLVGDGKIVDMLVGGSAVGIDEFFNNELLVKKIRKAAQRHPGLLQLPDPVEHRMMMDQAANWLRGLDTEANLSFLFGHPTQKRTVLIAFASYPVEQNAPKHLHQEIDRLRLMVVSQNVAKEALDDGAQIRARREPAMLRLIDVASAWTAQANEPDLGRDLVWAIEVRTSAGRKLPVLAGARPT